MSVMCLLHVPLATESVYLNIDEISSGFESSEITVADCNEIMQSLNYKEQTCGPFLTSTKCLSLKARQF